MNISKLRRSLMRSRTPTGAEMKQQNSLEVPPQVRSASFDEMQLKPGSQEPSPSNTSISLPAERQSFLLKVPYLGPKRSKSFDSGCGDVEDPYNRRRSPSVEKSAHHCVHCVYLEELERRMGDGMEQPLSSNASLDVSFSSSRDEADDEDDWDDDDSSADELHEVICGIRVTLSPNSPSSVSPTHDEPAVILNRSPSPRIRPSSPKLERQPAIMCMHAGGELSSQENSFDTSDGGYSHHGSQLYLGSSSEYGDTDHSGSGVGGSEPAISRRPSIITMRATRSADEYRSISIQEQVDAEEREANRGFTEIFLEVPSRRDRAASLDLPFSYSESDELQAPSTCLTRSISLEPPSSLRAKSIDIELPTDDNKDYRAVVTSSQEVKKAINSEVEIQCGNGEKRILRATCDWAEAAANGDHLWCQTSASGDFCYVGDDFCCKSGSRMKCSACKIICHMGCIAALVEKVKFICKPTFRDVGPRQYREHTETHHHWVHRRNQKGKCKSCGKGFQSKLLFGSKEIVAISCSWCKAAFHNKESCFDIAKIGETCNLGIHQSIIVPPSWIVKLPRRGSFKSSLRKSPKKRSSTKRKNKEKSDKDPRPFAIKAIPNANVRPVIVFINPKSGGNQGAKLMQKFQWLLNPRQVFDLTQGGPKAGLEMFKKVSNLRVLACGGDGTVGWILSILDQINISPAPSVGVLPLGTGNDLARALGWGGGYTDEPISKILCNIADGEIIYLDRWKCVVKKNPDYESTEDGKDSLPLNVVNNYFSFGVDAHIALEFHEAREANPQKFNSRLRNKMFYGQAGGKDLLQRKWKDLCEFCTLECDGRDMTHHLKENKVHAVVFLNIPSYCSGTHPWNRNSGIEQHTDDGLIEVVGLTTYQMPLLQAGGHGTCITQCRTARIVTKKTIPMQVDGEACRLNPSIIELSHLNTVAMITKTKAKAVVHLHLEQLRLEVSRITMFDYEQYHYDKVKLRAASMPLGLIMIDQDADLDQVRRHINRMMEETSNKSLSMRPLSENWCFLDSCTAERFFRIDRAQEHLHYVTDICTEELFVLDPEVTESSIITDAASLARADISVDNDADHTERLALVSDVDPNEEGPEADEKAGEENQTESQLFEKTSDLLIEAAKDGDVKRLKNLHSQGFSLLSVDAQGQTALHHSARLGHKDIVRYLIASAPPSILNVVDKETGQTALHQAAANKRRTVCCMLVAAGASLSVKDNQGNPPRTLAQKAEDRELAAYLENTTDSAQSPVSIPVPTSSASAVTVPPPSPISPARSISPGSEITQERQGYVSLGTQTCITLTAHSAACAEALSKALADALVEEEARLRLSGRSCNGQEQFESVMNEDLETTV